MTFFIGWVIFAVLVGFIAQSQNKGFALGFFLSLLLSPLLGFIIVLCMSPSKQYCEFCKSQLIPNDPFCPACERDENGKSKTEYRNPVIAPEPNVGVEYKADNDIKTGLTDFEQYAIIVLVVIFVLAIVFMTTIN